MPYLDRTFVDEEAVQFPGGLGGGAWTLEDDGGNAAAGAVLVVGQEDFLDWASGLVEVFLLDRRISISNREPFATSNRQNTIPDP